MVDGEDREPGLAVLHVPGGAPEAQHVYGRLSSSRWSRSSRKSLYRSICSGTFSKFHKLHTLDIYAKVQPLAVHFCH